MQNISAFLGQEVQRRAADWAAIHDLLVPALPPELLAKVRYAAEGDKFLTLFADSSAWAAKIRFYESEILKTMKARGRAYKSVRVRTLP